MDLASLSFCDCTEARFARLLRCAFLWLHALSALLRNGLKLSCHTGYFCCYQWPYAFRSIRRAATIERGKQVVMTVRDAQQLRRHRRGFEAFKPVCASVLINSSGSFNKAQAGVWFRQRGAVLNLTELLAVDSETARFRVMRCKSSKDMILIDRCVFLFAAN